MKKNNQEEIIKSSITKVMRERKEYIASCRKKYNTPEAVEDARKNIFGIDE